MEGTGVDAEAEVVEEVAVVTKPSFSHRRLL